MKTTPYGHLYLAQYLSPEGHIHVVRFRGSEAGQAAEWILKAYNRGTIDVYAMSQLGEQVEGFRRHHESLFGSPEPPASYKFWNVVMIVQTFVFFWGMLRVMR